MRRSSSLRRTLLAFGFAVVATLVVLLAGAQSRRAAIATLHRNVAPLVVRAPEFAQDPIPDEFSCRGAGHSPAISWSGAPPGTRSYLILIQDDDVPHPHFPISSFTHWILFNIASNTALIAANSSTADLSAQHIDVGLNSEGRLGYFAPCPPMGRHRYVISVFALNQALIEPKKKDPSTILESIKTHVLGYGSVVGLLQ